MQRFVTLLFSVVLLLVSSLPAACAERPLKIAFIYVSPAGETGWSHAHELARRSLENMPGISTSYVESVPEGGDAERIIARMADEGHDIIFTTSYGYMNPTAKVAARYPKTIFLHCSGYKTAPNLSAYFGRMYQARYLTGMVAGAMTKTNVIGYAAAYPIAQVVRGINAFTLGARAVNPKVEVRVQWTRTWYDLATEKDVARQLIDSGADVIAQHQDSSGPQEAAEEKGVFSIGYNTDMSEFAPKAHLVAAIWNWAPFYRHVIGKVRHGEWRTGTYWQGIESGIVDVSRFSLQVPLEVRDRVLKYKEAIISGAFDVFAGPITDRDGIVRIKAGGRATDEELLRMDWFVEGVVGGLE